MTPELQSKILIWRQKALDGTLSLEDQIEAVKALRESRESAFKAANSKAASSKARTSKPVLNADDLLSEL